MMTSDLITAPPAPEFNAEAELYFLPGGHYLFRRRSAAGVTSKFVTAPDVAAAFTGQEMDSGWLPPGVMRIGRHASKQPPRTHTRMHAFTHTQTRCTRKQTLALAQARTPARAHPRWHTHEHTRTHAHTSAHKRTHAQARTHP